MPVSASIRFCTLCLLTASLQSCATKAIAPEVATINLVSVNKATVQDMIISGDHSESFDAPGYKIFFVSDREIAPKVNHPNSYVFAGLDYYDCDSSSRYEPDHAYSARDYVKFQQSWAEIIDSKPDGSFIYEAQLLEGYSKTIRNICAKIFVHDGNINRKIWQPVFVSNEMKLDFN